MKVKINQSGFINVFKHMNQDIVDSYKRQGIVPSLHEHKQNFEEYHGVKIIVDNSNWSHVEFASEKDYLLKVLKWS